MTGAAGTAARAAVARTGAGGTGVDWTGVEWTGVEWTGVDWTGVARTGVAGTGGGGTGTACTGGVGTGCGMPAIGVTPGTLDDAGGTAGVGGIGPGGTAGGNGWFDTGWGTPASGFGELLSGSGGGTQLEIGLASSRGSATISSGGHSGSSARGATGTWPGEYPRSA
ncbi:hypothetical protein [Plantactinospora sp. B5E13]|uniref:hypothetical protein n=1 Tax=unclassified Plantactinospora TaxID=2631981 RepID=UPI00325F5AEA